MTDDQALVATQALAEAIAAKGVCNLASGLGIKHPSVCKWPMVPAGRVLAVERLTGVSRHRLRPDLYPPLEEAAS